MLKDPDYSDANCGYIKILKLVPWFNKYSHRADRIDFNLRAKGRGWEKSEVDVLLLNIFPREICFLTKYLEALIKRCPRS